MTFELQGLAAIVTGAAQGIGLAIAQRLSEAGVLVLGVDSDVRVKALESRGPMAEGGRTEAVMADVTRDSERIVAEALRHFGRIDIVCNNAGVMDGFASLADIDANVWDRVLAVNLTAPMRLTQAAMPQLLKQGGVVVNIASIASFLGSRGGVAYTSSKHGLLGLTRHIAAVYGPQGVRAVAVCPGSVDTGMDPRGAPAGRADELRALHSQWGTQACTPADVAGVVLFATSPAAARMNGATLVVDDGLTVL